MDVHLELWDASPWTAMDQLESLQCLQISVEYGKIFVVFCFTRWPTGSGDVIYSDLCDLALISFEERRNTLRLLSGFKQFVNVGLGVEPRFVAARHL